MIKRVVHKLISANLNEPKQHGKDERATNGVNEVITDKGGASCCMALNSKHDHGTMIKTQ